MLKVHKKVVGLLLLVSFMFLTIFTLQVKALDYNNDEQYYFWTQEMSNKAQEYEAMLIEDRNNKIKSILNIDDKELSKYIDDFNLFYNIAKEYDKVEEIEEVITEYEKKYMYYEIMLLTRDENLANRYYNDSNNYFKFERVIECFI